MFIKTQITPSSKPLSKATLSDDDCNAILDSPSEFGTNFSQTPRLKESFICNGANCYNSGKFPFEGEMPAKLPSKHKKCSSDEGNRIQNPIRFAPRQTQSDERVSSEEILDFVDEQLGEFKVSDEVHHH